MLLFLLTFQLSLTTSLNLYYPPTTHAAAFSVEEVPGIQYASRGYNIMFGNPHSTGTIDAGILGVVFDLSNCSNRQTYNGYLVPNGVSVLPSPTCVEKFTYNAISGANSYSESLKQSVSFDAGLFDLFSFSASKDYQSVYTTTTKYSSIYTSSYVQCSCYLATINAPYDLPSFSTNFKGEIAHMPLIYNSTNLTNLQFFYDFFTKYFGTHYITNIEMGGIFGALSSMDSFSYSKFTSSNLDIEVSASLSTLHASAAVSSMTQQQKQQAEDFNSLVTEQEIFNIGGNLPADGNISQWQQSLSTKPMPINYHIDVITKLLTSENFPYDKNITKKQSALQAALDDYCNVLANNDTFGKIDCAGYPPDPSIPPKSIIQGFYASNIDNQPVNPYTNDHNCNQGYTPILYATYKDQHNAVYSSYYCINLTEVNDMLLYFGGMFERVISSYACKIGNVFTGDVCKCPNGMVEQYVTASITGGNVDVQVFACYNATTPLDQTIMGGFYSTTSNSQNHGPIPNPYTKTTSCPAGFTAYHTGTECVYHDGCLQSLSTYICLSNVYGI